MKMYQHCILYSIMFFCIIIIGNNDIIVQAEEQEHLGNAKGMPIMTSMLKKAAGVTRSMSATVTDKEACVGCRFVWAKTNAILDESAGYEAVKDAFERTCAHMPEVFYDSCDKMFENEDRLIQEYLEGESFNAMCEAVLLCAPGMIKGTRSGLGVPTSINGAANMAANQATNMAAGAAMNALKRI